MSAELIRVAIADDEQLVVAGIRSILQSSPTITCVGAASDGEEALVLLKSTQADVILLDLDMPVLNGFDTLDRIRTSKLRTRVLVLTTFGTEANLQRCLMAGADGFLLKASSPSEIIAAVESTARGGAAISPHVAKFLVDAFRRGTPEDEQRDLGNLTAREREVLGLLSRGMSNADIAQRLHLTEGTVKGYLRTVFHTLNVDNRVQAALIGYKAGLADI